MNQSLDLNSIGSAISHFFRRFHTIIYIVIISAGLAVCIFIVLSIINTSANIDMNAANAINQTFDQKTLDKVQQLQSSSLNEGISLPSDGSRTNPFVD